MQTMNCLIVEDEPLAADIIKDYIRQVPGLSLAGICENAFQAMETLRTEKIGLIFLDINLPRLNGIDFLKAIKTSPHIILTTAYHQYALEGYDLNVTDYLLKPVEFNRFLQAVNKVFDRTNPSLTEENKFYFFNVDKTRIKVLADEIIYIEALKDYIGIHTGGKRLVTKLQIGEIERILNDKRFVRIHKSFVINSKKINAFTATQVDVAGTKLTIGRSYKKKVETFLAGLH